MNAGVIRFVLKIREIASEKDLRSSKIEVMWQTTVTGKLIHCLCVNIEPSFVCHVMVSCHFEPFCLPIRLRIEKQRHMPQAWN
jgi:hypothetical protein